MNETRARILDVARELLGRNPDAGMGEIASAAGVVRRTVYGHFPSRTDLVRTLAEQAVGDMTTVATAVSAADELADAAWADFVTRLWPLAQRYRVLISLRRGEYGDELHTLLAPVDAILADVVTRGQSDGAFGRHLTAGILSQIALAAVFSVAADDSSNGPSGARAAAITSLLLLGVPESRAVALADQALTPS